MIFDSGYGGEAFADYLENEIPIVEIIRVIDWRNAKEILENSRRARKIAEEALRPYIGKVDLIFFANHLISLTSLKYFRRHYKNQTFLGFKLSNPQEFVSRPTLILTTQALTKTISFHNYLFRFHSDKKVICLDHWPALIDDGELTDDMVRSDLEKYFSKNIHPEVLVLTCSQFSDIKEQLRKVIGHNIKIKDSFADSTRQICKTLKIRGGMGKKKKS